MKIGAVAACFAPATEPHQLLNLAIKMDEAGMDALWFGEHVLLFDEMEFGYPGSADGKLPVPAGQGTGSDSHNWLPSQPNPTTAFWHKHQPHPSEKSGLHGKRVRNIGLAFRRARGVGCGRWLV